MTSTPTRPTEHAADSGRVSLDDEQARSSIHVSPKPKPASNDCLPHAAMNLGSVRGVDAPVAGMVSRLVIEAQVGNWVLYRMDADGGFVGDTWHDTRDDALRQIKREFGVDVSPYREVHPMSNSPR